MSREFRSDEGMETGAIGGTSLAMLSGAKHLVASKTIVVYLRRDSSTAVSEWCEVGPDGVTSDEAIIH